MVLINKRTGELFEKYLTEGKQVAISVNFPMVGPLALLI